MIHARTSRALGLSSKALDASPSYSYSDSHLNDFLVTPLPSSHGPPPQSKVSLVGQISSVSMGGG
eukprot:3769964-Pyramimonas_sp.AAC.1